MLEIINNKPLSFILEDFTYLKVSTWNRSIEQSVVQCDGIILTSQSKIELEKIIISIRTHERPDIYLKPVYTLTKTLNNLSIHTEGIFDNNTSNQLTQEINERIVKITGTSIRSQQSLELKLMHYLYTRNGLLSPQKDRHCLSGYSYPFVDCYYNNEDFEKYKLFKQCIKNEWLDNSLIDRVQLCTNCNDSYLVYKETCPKCQSIDIQANDVIHHFPCAHIAPASEFKKGENDAMECPKCDKHLRHIGIDYDKPSVVFTCNNCEHHFQHAEIMSECHSCDTKNKLEELIEVDIHSYKITMNGIMKVENGTTVTNKKESILDGMIIFEQLIAQEQQRVFVNGKSSFRVKVNLQSKLFKILSDSFLQQLWSDIEEITQSYVSSSIYSARKEETIHLLIVDKTENEVSNMIEKLEYNIGILLEDNLGNDVQLTITSKNVQTG